MATARYNEKYEGWILEYTNHRKVAEGKRGDSKKKFKDRNYPKLSKRQKEMKYGQMLNLALELEAKSRRGIVNKDNAEMPVLAIDYLPHMQVVSKSQRERAIKDRWRLITEFVEFLTMRYKKYYLHEINDEVARAYLSQFSHLSAESLDKRRRGLSAVFKRIQRKMENLGSYLHYRNPFNSKDILDGIKKTEAGKVTKCKRKAFALEQIKTVIEHAYAQHSLLGCVWHIGFLTGWRLSDILSLQWSQVELSQREITIISSKSEIPTRIYITDGMMQLLDYIKEHSDATFLFPDEWRGMSGSTYKTCKVCTLNRRILAGLGFDEHSVSGVQKCYAYSFHSLRGTMKTALKNNDFNRDRIDYLVGHRGKGVDKEHYDKFYDTPEESTRDMIEYLETFIQNPKGV